jgi:hypothetical protein
VLEDARDAQGPHLGQPADRATADEQIWHHVSVAPSVGEPLAQSRRPLGVRLEDLEVVAGALKEAFGASAAQGAPTRSVEHDFPLIHAPPASSVSRQLALLVAMFAEVRGRPYRPNE